MVVIIFDQGSPEHAESVWDHTFGRELVGFDTDISAVAELLGPADINITRRYSKPTEDDLGAAIDKAFDSRLEVNAQKNIVEGPGIQNWRFVLTREA